MRNANFDIVKQTPEALTLIDIGPWDKFPTITNAAEEVVEELSKRGLLKDGKRLLYYDSEKELTELIHKAGRFVGFKSP